VAGLTGGDRRGYRRMAGDRECRIRRARGAELEAAGIHVRRGVAARAVAIEGADRHVIAGGADERDVDERPDRGTVTGQTPGHTLVGAGDGVEREVAHGRMALRAHRGSWNVIGGLRSCRQQIRRESGCHHVAGAAVATGRVLGIVRGRTRVSSGGRRARGHPYVGPALVTGCAGGDRRRDGGVAGGREGRTGDARGAELEAAGVDVRGAVAARAVAVEAADGHVIAGRADQGDVDEGSDRGTVTGQTPGHTLVGGGDGIQRIVARGGVALRARRRGWNVIGGLAGRGHIAGKGRRTRVAAHAITRGRMKCVECCRGTRIAGAAAGAGQHPHVGRGLVAGRAGAHRRHRRVARDAERGSGDARGAELEAPRIHAARAVAARAVAIEAADRNVVAGGGDQGDVDERADRGAVTGQTPGHTLVGAGD